MNAPSERYPLQWPTGWPRTDRRKQETAHFRSSDTKSFYVEGHGYRKETTARRVTIADAFERLSKELERLGASNPLLSSNLETRLNGAPRSGQTEPYDNGVAVYFKLKGRNTVLACDKWNRVADNIAAIAQHIDALRRIDRYGIGSLEQAFAGYQALPAQAASWFTVLEFSEPPKNWDVIESRFKSLARVHHPDRGGNAETMAKINTAYDTARLEFGK